MVEEKIAGFAMINDYPEASIYTIIDSQGPDCVDEQFLEDQYLWLKKWFMHIPY